MTDEEAIEQFHALPEVWLMEFEAGWWAFWGDERLSGPFHTQAEAARAGSKAWLTKQ